MSLMQRPNDSRNMKLSPDKSTTTMSNHIVPNILRDGLHLVFCGTAPSHTSAMQRAYYAHRHNRFWKTLDEVGLTSGQLEPSEYQRLQQFGIGLTDLCKTDSGNDDEIPKGALNVADLAENIKRFEPRSALTASGRRRKVSYVASGSEDIDL